MHIFILSASKQVAQARKLNRRLKALGYATWWEQPLPGNNKNIARHAALEKASLAVVFIDKAFHEDSGDHQAVLKDALAIQKKTPEAGLFIVPVLLEGVDILFSLEKENWAESQSPRTGKRFSGFVIGY